MTYSRLVLDELTGELSLVDEEGNYWPVDDLTRKTRKSSDEKKEDKKEPEQNGNQKV